MFGIAGMAWAIEHVRDYVLPAEDGNFLDEVDAGILEILHERSNWSESIDVFSGLVGIGIYALERRERRDALKALRLIVRRLGDAAQRDARGVYWTRTHQNWESPLVGRDESSVVVDLGMAGGQASCVALLSLVAALDACGGRVGDLLVDATGFLMACHRSTADDGWYSGVVIDGVDGSPVHTAWCYGDPGVCIALTHADQIANIVGLRKQVDGMFDSLIKRPCTDPSIYDVCLCHGAAGVGHILNRISQRYADDRLRNAAVRWFRHVLALRQPGHGVGGFSFLWNGVPEATSGILRGGAGVGLALLAAATDTEPDWDRLLML